MAEPIATIENLGKQYPRKPEAHAGYGIQDILRRIVGKSVRVNRYREAFWAVRDVSFELFPGETVGIIGVNGSGKTTLLRMIAGMIQPDMGHARCRGHLQAIINLNAGFKPRLTGVENVKNALSLRGFSGRAARDKLDEIVEFAEVGEFIDHPITHYSSGMAARLAFSTCIFLDPDLLIVDEALSVGDRSFKNKCLLKMAELKAQGISMLFVSHSMGQVQHFCDRTLWLNRGEVMGFGDTKQIIEQYIGWIDDKSVQKQKERKAKAKAQKNGTVDSSTSSTADPLHGDLHHVREVMDLPTCRINGVEDDLVVVNPHEPMTIDYAFRLHQSIQDTTIVIKVHRHDGLLLARLSSRDDGNHDLGTIGPGIVEGQMELADVNLAPGQYALIAEIVTGSRAFLYRGIMGEFHVRQVNCHFNGLIGMRRRHVIRLASDDAGVGADQGCVNAT